MEELKRFDTRYNNLCDIMYISKGKRSVTMKVIGKELRKDYCGGVYVGCSFVYVIDELPKERDYIEIDNKKGYVISSDYDEQENWYCIYLENNLDDWNNQIIDIPNTTIFVTLKENRKGDE